jgi:hypothetical protein
VIRPVAIVARHRVIDLLAAAGAGVYAGTIDDRWLATSPNRVTIYVALFGAATTLLGFVVGALAVIKGIGEGPRITELRRRHGGTITASMQGATWALLALFIVSLGALIAEAGRPGQLSLSLTYGAIAFSALRLGRMVWIVGVILTIGDTDDRLTTLKKSRRRAEPRSQRRHVS